MGGAAYGVGYGSVGAILVLFILLVIITSAFV
ncbi:YjcZ family sporulation protein [Paenibacillus lemnae]|nr:YjcZ family sporulation protein [Paenibacillus lemnae]